VEAVTVDDLQAAAKQFIKPDRLSIVLVGDASKFVGQLRAQGFNDFERIPIDQLDLTAPALRKGGSGGSEGSEGSGGSEGLAGAINSAPALVQKIADAKGGITALRALKTIDVQADVTISGSGAPVKMQTRNLVAYPDKFRVEADTPGGKVVQVFAGTEAWVETSAGAMNADADARADYRSSAARDLVPLIVNAVDGKVTVTKLPDDVVGGAPVHVLQFTPTAGGPLVLLVDPKTFEIRGMRYPTDPAPNASQASEFYDDYRDVSGVKVAFRARVERDGMVIDRLITSVRMNTALPPTAFVRKAA
jgi:hypothetical protein